MACYHPLPCDTIAPPPPSLPFACQEHYQPSPIPPSPLPALRSQSRAPFVTDCSFHSTLVTSPLGHGVVRRVP
jgi:hypothetical protein